MKFQGQYTLPAPPAKVWDLLIAPGGWGKLLPGSERLVSDGPDRFKANLESGTGTIEFAEKNPPHSMLLKLSGKGILGSVDAAVRIELAGKDDQTELRYTGEAQLGGFLAAIGPSMIEGGAQKIMDQAFAAIAEELK